MSSLSASEPLVRKRKKKREGTIRLPPEVLVQRKCLVCREVKSLNKNHYVCFDCKHRADWYHSVGGY